MNEKKKSSQKKSYSDETPYPEINQLTDEDLRQQNQEFEKENIILKDLLRQYGVEYKDHSLSDTEYICLKQLSDLNKLSRYQSLTKDEVAMVDLLHKNLLLARNIPLIKKSKKEKKSVEELLEIVQGSND